MHTTRSEKEKEGEGGRGSEDTLKVWRRETEHHAFVFGHDWQVAGAAGSMVEKKVDEAQCLTRVAGEEHASLCFASRTVESSVLKTQGAMMKVMEKRWRKKGKKRCVVHAPMS